jgi:hypothetical protein
VVSACNMIARHLGLNGCKTMLLAAVLPGQEGLKANGMCLLQSQLPSNLRMLISILLSYSQHWDSGGCWPALARKAPTQKPSIEAGIHLGGVCRLTGAGAGEGEGAGAEGEGAGAEGEGAGAEGKQGGKGILGKAASIAASALGVKPQKPEGEKSLPEKAADYLGVDVGAVTADTIKSWWGLGDGLGGRPSAGLEWMDCLCCAVLRVPFALWEFWAGVRD